MNHCVETKSQTEKHDRIDIENMIKLFDLGEILYFKHYSDENLIFVLSHPADEPNKH